MTISRTTQFFAIAFASLIALSPAYAWKGEFSQTCLVQKIETNGSGNKVENSGSGNKVENSGSDNKVQDSGSDNKVENSGSGSKVENSGSGNKMYCENSLLERFFGIF